MFILTEPIKGKERGTVLDALPVAILIDTTPSGELSSIEPLR